MRQRGDIQTNIIIFVVVALFLVGAAVAFQMWLSDVRKEARGEGMIAEREKWERRENEELAAAQAEVARLTVQLNHQARAFMAQMAMAETDYQKGVNDAQARTDSFIGDVFSGRVRLLDPGRPAPGCTAGDGGAPAGAGAARAGDAKAGAELSAEAARFLFLLTGEADEVVEQLRLAQAGLVAYYELCR